MTHEIHIARHLTQLAEHYDAAQVGRVLETCAFTFDGKKVRKRDGNLMSDPDCVRYLTSLDEVFGSSVSAFARVNFILTGCRAAKSVA